MKWIENLYHQENYKKLLILPVILLIISIYFITQIELGIDLAGGTRITVITNNQIGLEDLKSTINSQFNIKDLKLRQTTGLNSRLYIEFAYEENVQSLKDSESKYIQAREKFKNDFISLLTASIRITEEKISFEEVGPTTGAVFWEQARNALILAFVIISILIFIFFRKILTSLAVIQAAVFDVIVGLGAIGFLGIPLSLASIAPLLMLIGYSVDTDIMLVDRILKRKGKTLMEKLVSAFKTGITITGTTIGAMTAMMIISYLTNMDILFNISLIMIIGLFGDIIATWCTNAGIMIWIEKK